MSETIKASNGEKIAESAESSNVDILAEMSGTFDQVKAERLAERDKLKSAEEPKDEEEDSERPDVTPEKQEEELSPKDAANEYLALLDELSQDFSNPYYSDIRKREYSHYAGGITEELGLKYSDNPHYRLRGNAGTEAGEADGTMHRIASADCIIGYEIGWRDEGEKNGEKLNQIQKMSSDLDAKYAAKSRLGRMLGKRKYQREKSELAHQEYTLGLKLRGYNHGISKELAISYNESGHYDYDPENHDHGESKNEERNRRFFGLDDPERAKKVKRAIELRRKYEDVWSKEE